MKYLYLCVVFFTSFHLFAQTDTTQVQLNFEDVSRSLLSSPVENFQVPDQLNNSEQLVYLPTQNGTVEAFKLLEYFIVPENLRKEIKTYHGRSVKDPTLTCRITMYNGALRANFYTSSEIYVLEKDKSVSDTNTYLRFKAEMSLPECGTNESHELELQKEVIRNGRKVASFLTHGTELRTYKLALLATTSLYTAGGGNDADVNAYVTSIVNNTNELLEKEIAVRLTLISPNNPVSTNVFYQYGGSTSLGSIISENNTRFGNENFDIGHCIRSSGGGVAYLGVICNSGFKGGGLSGVSPTNLLVFAHELGHQFSAGHTFNGNGSGNCGPGNRSNSHAIEPGSGNTIMSYANLCSPGSYNITGGKVPYYHIRSLNSMINHITTRPASCGVVSNTGNNPPVVSTTAAYTIPKGTPFVLTGSATDADGDVLNYTWEQYDIATLSDSGALGHTANASGFTAVNSTTAPLFRTYQSTNPERTFPSMQYILNNGNNPTDNVGEDLPLVARTINFKLTARDNRTNGGGIDVEDVVVNVADSGPFRVSVGNGPTLWFVNESKNITWDVNNTDQAPVSCANVRILTSVDGGSTFTELIASTPNDGSHPFTVPSTAVTDFRIKIEAVGNVFFDINDSPIQITDQACAPETSQLLNNSSLSEYVGSNALAFDPVGVGTAISSFSGEITNSSNSSNLVFKNASGVCASPYSNAPAHQIHTFVAGTTASTTFSIGSGTLPSKNLNLYEGAYNILSQCANWINSSATETSAGGIISLSGSVSQGLSQFQKYDLRVSGFSTGHVGTYQINLSGGPVYPPMPLTGSSYDYIYLVYDTNSGDILSFQTQCNLTSFAAGNYRVYGLSFAGGLDLSTYINTSFASFQAALANNTVCGLLSTNFKDVTISSCPSIPDAPSVAPATIFLNETATLEAVGCTSVTHWYATPSTTTILSMGSTFTTPALNSTITYYASCVETCESSRTAVTVTVVSYCTLSQNCSDNDEIINVKLIKGGSNILDNSSTTCSPNGYNFYNNPITDITQSDELTIEVTKETSWPDGVGVWIDFNRNGSFGDSGEQVASFAPNTTATQSAVFTVPPAAATGNLRMRVKLDFNATPTDPCTPQSSDGGAWGETEDYLVNILPANNCVETISLVSSTDDIASGTQTFQTNNNAAGTNPGLIQATNIITGGNTTYDAGKKVELNPGFQAGNGAVFSAQIGGCN